MKAVVGVALGSALLAHAVPTKEFEARDVDTRFPYTGPAVPIGDWVDPTVNGNGKGFPRLVEPPAVKPANSTPSNNVNVISLSYAGAGGVNIHYQTPFGLGVAPSVQWGVHKGNLSSTATGATDTYRRPEHAPSSNGRGH